MDVGTEVWVKAAPAATEGSGSYEQDAPGDACTSASAVWIPGVVLDCQEMHAAAGAVKVKLATTGEIVTRRYVGAHDGDERDHAAEIHIRNAPRDIRRLASLIGLEHLHEPALLHALSERFAGDHIYTSIGEILLAVNPFRDLELYTDAKIDEYRAAIQLEREGRGRDVDDDEAPPPHVFAIAARAFAGLTRTDARNQSILVSGESGSGKTESTKFLMKFLTAVGHASTATMAPTASGSLEIGKRILQTNPILESFGNAQTIRNDNSSRFGKFIKIQFDGQSNEIVGAEISSYLLEKVRLIHQSPQERNFHIFYELLEGADTELLVSLGLERGAKYEILNDYGRVNMMASGNRQAHAAIMRAYAHRFRETIVALSDTGVTHEECLCVFRILAALLHLGNVNCIVRASTPPSAIGSSTGTAMSEEIAIVDEASRRHLEICASLLGVAVDSLEALLLTREITAGTDVVTLRLNTEQAKDASRSLAKAIYGRLFAWLVGRLSDSINFRDDEYTSEDRSTDIRTIGILDIFGFESLETNGFEQMCINYANERLQSQFNEFVFVKEQDIYGSEGIDWRSIPFPNNAACLTLFDDKTSGLFSLLDQECMMPKGSNQALSTKYYRYHGENLSSGLLSSQLPQKYTLPLLVTSFGRYLQPGITDAKPGDKDNIIAEHRTPFSASKMDRVQHQFVIQHFAGRVRYRIDHFLEKNQDALPTDAIRLLSTSSNELVAAIGGVDNIEDAADSGRVGRSRSRSRGSLLRAPSVSAQFRGQLDLLIDEIGQTEAHYIRCLKPNEHKRPKTFDRQRMVEQLRSVGVLEALRIARAGYSARLPHKAFIDMFSCFFDRLRRSGTDITALSNTDVCKALVALLVDEVQSDNHKQRNSTVLRTFVNSPTLKFNEIAREHGVQFGRTLVFCKTEAYNNFFRIRYLVRDRATRMIQRVMMGYHERQRFLWAKACAMLIQAHVRGYQARNFAKRLQYLRQRVAVGRIQRFCRQALVNMRAMDARVQLFRIRRVFANFKLGCTIGKEAANPLAELQSCQGSSMRRDVSHVTDEMEHVDLKHRGLGDAGSVDDSIRDAGIRWTTNKHHGPRQRGRLSSSSSSCSDENEPEDEQTEDLRHEIERLQKLLVAQKSRGKTTQKDKGVVRSRSRFASVDVTSSRQVKLRGRADTAGAESADSGDEFEAKRGVRESDDDSDDHPVPRRAKSVSYARRQSEHVHKLNRRLEELDAKCKQLERLVARPGYDERSRHHHTHHSRYPHYGHHVSSSSRRQSIANSDGSNGYAGSDSQLHETASNSSQKSGVESLIWSIQQQMDVLRQSVAVKTEDEQARHDAHTMSFASSLPTRSSTITSNGSGTHHEDAAMETDYPALPSPARTNSDLHFGYHSAPNSSFYHPHDPMMPSTPSEGSFYMGQPRSAPGHLGGGYGYPPVAKWTRSTHCHECQEAFTIFTRRHHCRMCGNSFCHEHSSRRVPLYGMGFDDEPQRVCDACFGEYQAQPSEYYAAPTPTGMHAQHTHHALHMPPPPSPYMRQHHLPYPQRSHSQYHYPTYGGPPHPPVHPPPPYPQSRYSAPAPYYSGSGMGPPPPPPPSSHTSAA